MATAIEHYEQLLAQHYTWMAGGLDATVERAKAAFQGLGIRPKGATRAIDLGAGSGAQSLALAELGFEVWAMDTNVSLLNELSQHDHANRVHVVKADMVDIAAHCPEGGVDLIVCMGDSLLHLRSGAEVRELLTTARECLRVDGELVLSFRELTFELKGTDRMIPVRSDPDRIMTCFLEYFPDLVMVHDLIYTRQNDGWALHKSAYPKLRLSVDAVRGYLDAASLQVEHEDIARGLVTLRAKAR